MSVATAWPEPFDGDELAGQVCLVTGAAQGIGAAISERLAQLGATIAVTDLNEQGAQERAARLRDSGYEAAPFALDVRDTRAIEAAVEKIEETLGPIEVVVNNAGLCNVVESTAVTDEDWDLHVDVMLTGPFKLARRVAPGMLERGRGAIVSICSIGGFGGWPQRAAYNSAKGGIKVMTEVLATEWAPRGVRVNAVAPAVTRTEILEQVVANSGGRIKTDEFAERTPLGRIAEAGEIADAVAFLASPRASSVTGETLAVDGGWLASDGFPVVRRGGSAETRQTGAAVRTALVAEEQPVADALAQGLGTEIIRVSPERIDEQPAEPLREGESLVWIHMAPAASGRDLEEASLLLRSVRAAERFAATTSAPLTFLALLPSRGLFTGPEGLGCDLARDAFSGLMKAEIGVWSARGDRIAGIVYAEVEGQRSTGLRTAEEARLRTPSGQPTTAAQLADAIRFLGSDRAAYVTGTLLHVDGGWNAYSWRYPTRTI